ncbi:MAG: GH25 family lysozyme, partial [Chloroflexota bacterium]
DHTRAQIASARAAGCTIGGYVWCYRDLDPRKTVRDAVTLARSSGVTLPILWLDCETYTSNGTVHDPGPDGAWLQKAISEAAGLGSPVGIYTAGWWWREFMDNTRDFAEVPLWLAQYDGIPQVDVVSLFGGWLRASGKQWAVKLPDGGELDRNVFLGQVAGAGGDQIPTLASLEADRPNLRQQVLEWQRARYRNRENPNDYPACREHLRRLRVLDPGPREFLGFRRPTIEELEATTPAIRSQLREWKALRRQRGEDPNDYPAGRQHLVAIGCPDPGVMEFLGFAD